MPFLEQVVVNVSVLTIMAISIERYYAICKPLRAGYTWTKMRALVVIVIVWVAAMVTSRSVGLLGRDEIRRFCWTSRL